MAPIFKVLAFRGERKTASIKTFRITRYDLSYNLGLVASTLSISIMLCVGTSWCPEDLLMFMCRIQHFNMR